jgi:uncharacterized membrane protein
VCRRTFAVLPDYRGGATACHILSAAAFSSVLRFDFFRIRAHILEVYFFGPTLRGQGVRVDNGWNATLYQDYIAPALHITFLEAVGRRLRHNYGWIFFIQVTAYIGRLLIHPTPIGSVHDFFARATIGPVSGQFVLLAGLLSMRPG